MKDRLGDKTRLLHIIDSIEEIKDYLKDSKFEEFRDNSMMRNACIRQLEIIGEACGKISEKIRGENSGVAWKSIVGLRNILIHQYFGVDIQVIWDIIQSDIPDLEIQIRKILKEVD